jgi:SPP1 gp7 family putative phage head morphogenesis protein
LIDSVFSPLLEVPFPDDVPLIPAVEITRGLDAVGAPASEIMARLQRDAAEVLLRKAGPFLADRNLAGIQSLTWNLGVTLQSPIYSVWALGFELGSGHMLREMKAALPKGRFATTQEAVAALLVATPTTITNTPAQAAVARRALTLAGNFSGDQLTAIKGHLQAAIVPVDGKLLSRPELLQKIEGTLLVGKTRAEMIARTELTNAYNSGRVQTALQSSLVTHFRFLAISDARTTPICRGRNGMLIPVTDRGAIGANSPALHVRCRSVLSPVMAGLNPTHAKWAQDPERDYQARNNLAPLPKGWRTGVLPDPPTPPPTPTAPVSEKKPKGKPKEFPASLGKLEKIDDLGGSTGAQLVRDPVTGDLFVLKRGANAAHIEEEFAAEKAYQALGVKVPPSKLYKTKDGPVKLSKYVEGRSLGDALSTATAAGRAEILGKLQKDFAADALLGNWDAIGMSLDNVLIDAAGNPWRIDTGGSLRFRAQGSPKGDAWGNYPGELFSLRNPRVNAQTAGAFGRSAGLSWADILDQVDTIASKQKELLKALPADLRATMKARIAEAQYAAKVGRTLMNDAFLDSYADDFAKHAMGIRQAGIRDRLPTVMKPSGRGSVVPLDQDGQAFDHLRGPDSVVLDLRDYINTHGGNYDAIIGYQRGQSTSSWSPDSSALKHFVMKNRSVDAGQYYVAGGVEGRFKNAIAQYGEEAYAESMAAWHAFNHEMLSKAQMPGYKFGDKLRLVRTENQAVIQGAGLKVGDRGVTMVRGAVESTSLYNPVTVYGGELTVQDVPIHRVMGTYWTEKTPGTGTLYDSGFLDDDENEFTAILENVPFHYKKSLVKASGLDSFDPLDPGI